MSDKIKALRERYEAQKKIDMNLKSIKNIIAIMSGKGGVGKSTVTSRIATGLALRGKNVGILDSDFHGPSIPKIFGVEKSRPTSENQRLNPVIGALNIKIMSIEFFLKEKETPVIWRGPIKWKTLRILLADTNWGDLDYLLIDLPPGTGDEPLSIIQLIPSLKGVLIVSHPSKLSSTIVNKSGNMAKQLGVPILGIIENMSGFICSKCHTTHNLFGLGGGEQTASYLKVPLLVKIPIEPKIAEDADLGKISLKNKENTPAEKAYSHLVDKILEMN